MEVQVDSESAIALVDAGEASSVAEIIKAVEALLAHPDFVDGMDTIFDYSRCDFSNVSAEDLKSIARFLVPHLSRFANRVNLVDSFCDRIMVLDHKIWYEIRSFPADNCWIRVMLKTLDQKLVPDRYLEGR